MNGECTKAMKTRTTKELALIVYFSALYAVFCVFPIFQIVGLPNRSITMAAVMAPVIGIVLGPYCGALSAVLGGLIGLSFGVFSPISLVSGIVTSFFAGAISLGKRNLCAFVYFSLLLFFGFYPFVGPVWLYPQLIWFQIFGFLVLVSPLQSTAAKNTQNPKGNGGLMFGIFITSLIASLAGQIAGSLIYEIISWPILIADINAWKLNWQIVTWLYPLERIIIALASTLIGTALHKVLKPADLM